MYPAFRSLAWRFGLAPVDCARLPTAGAKDNDPVLARMIEQALKGRPNAAPWHLRTRALEGAGYLAGDIVITDASVTANAGDAVIAQVFDPRSGSPETVFRILESPYLVAASSDPAPIDRSRVSGDSPSPSPAPPSGVAA